MEIKKRNKDENRQRSLFRPEDQFMPLREAMDRLLSESFLDPFETLSRNRTNRRVGFPKVDISESDDEIEVKADLPGIDPDNVQVEVDKNHLSIKGEEIEEKEDEDEDKKFYRKERRYGKFNRTFRLPSEIDVDSVEATSEDGTLTISLPKTKSSSKKEVEIQSK